MDDDREKALFQETTMTFPRSAMVWCCGIVVSMNVLLWWYLIGIWDWYLISGFWWVILDKNHSTVGVMVISFALMIFSYTILFSIIRIYLYVHPLQIWIYIRMYIAYISYYIQYICIYMYCIEREKESHNTVSWLLLGDLAQWGHRMSYVTSPITDYIQPIFAMRWPRISTLTPVTCPRTLW